MDRLWRLLRFMARSTKRLAIFIVGMGVVVVGIVMIPAPGPGWLVVFAGLALLATEFTWAEILLERAKRQANRAKDMAMRSVQSRRRTTTTPLEVRAIVPTVDDSSNGRAASGPGAPAGAGGDDRDNPAGRNGDRSDGHEDMANEHRSR